jgi:hypothetical protein
MTKKQHIYIPDQLMKILVNIDDLIPYEGNPRVHTKASQEELKAAILKYGFTTPIQINQEGKIITGHNRRKQMIALGHTQIPAIVYKTKDEKEYLEALASDNKVAELSKWDGAGLKKLFEVLDEYDEEDLQVPGFGDEDLDKIFGTTFKETLETKADFGEGNEVDVMDPKTRVTSMTFKMTVPNHKKVKDVIGAIMRENDYEDIGEALVFMTTKFKGSNKTIRRQA